MKIIEVLLLPLCLFSGAMLIWQFMYLIYQMSKASRAQGILDEVRKEQELNLENRAFIVIAAIASALWSIYITFFI